MKQKPRSFDDILKDMTSPNQDKVEEACSELRESIESPVKARCYQRGLKDQDYQFDILQDVVLAVKHQIKNYTGDGAKSWINKTIEIQISSKMKPPKGNLKPVDPSNIDDDKVCGATEFAKRSSSSGKGKKIGNTEKKQVESENVASEKLKMACAWFTSQELQNRCVNKTRDNTSWNFSEIS